MAALPRGEHALHPLLLALLVLVLAAKPMVDLGLLPRGAMAVAMLLTIMAGLVGLAPQAQRLRSLLVVTGVAAMGLQGLALGVAGEETDLGATAGAMLNFALLAFAVLRQSLAPGRVTLRRIEGAIAAYLLIGLIFAGAYDLAAALAPGAFLQNGQPMAAQALGGDFTFFSFVTLTSTGYGDLVPIHPVARSLAILEAITGQLYLVIVLARLVSLEIADRRPG
jgi:hypothetical protein